MGYPRSRIVDSLRPGWFHCISRCTRRLFLCGQHHAYRKQWIEDRLALLAELFAVDLGAYAILSNHLHFVIRTDPERAKTWSELEIAERWARLYPRRIERATAEAETREEAERLRTQFLDSLAQNVGWIDLWRKRLASLSWFNKLLKEPIARRANREDDVTGHFWEGRFRCIPLLSEGAVLACMVYVDLNPIRARIVAALRDILHTSIAERLEVALSGASSHQPTTRASARQRTHARKRRPNKVRLLPIESIFRMTTAQYVSLVAETGGTPAAGKHDEALRSVGIDPALWASALVDSVRWFGTAIGRTRDLLEEATRRATRSVVNPLRIFVE